MKNYFKVLVFLSVAILITSCVSRKNITYFLNDEIDQSKFSNQFKTIIKPDDLLQISIKPFDNVGVVNLNLIEGNIEEKAYLVDSNGYINFPFIGKLRVAELTKDELIDLLKSKLDPDYIKNPSINLRFLNFKISVLGSVKSSGSYTIPNERITILEAIALAGDLTLDAKRNNVLLIREEGNKIMEYQVDLLSKELFTSPVYYLQQNDVIYVEKNYSGIQSASTNTSIRVFVPILSALVLIITRFF